MSDPTTDDRRVLVVEDDPDYAELLATILRGHGYEVGVAYDGEDAQDMVRERPPDVITLDIQMPRKGGVRFFRELKSDDRFREVPVVVVTGLTVGDRDMENFIHAFLDVEHLPMPDAYLEKPVDGGRLVEVVGAALRPLPV